MPGSISSCDQLSTQLVTHYGGLTLPSVGAEWISLQRATVIDGETWFAVEFEMVTPTCRSLDPSSVLTGLLIAPI